MYAQQYAGVKSGADVPCSMCITISYVIASLVCNNRLMQLKTLFNVR